jgi:S-adenosyl methyltransferase
MQMDGLVPGSYLVVSDGVDTDPAGSEAQDRYNRQSPVPYHLRSPARLAGFFDGLRLAAPGVVSCPQWRPDPQAATARPEAPVYCGVAVKP